MFVPIRVCGPRNYIDTYAFVNLDSEMSFFIRKIWQKLTWLERELPKRSLVRTTGSQCHRGNMVSISVKDLLETNVIRIPDDFTMNQLPNVAESVPSDLDVSRWKDWNFR